MRRPLPGAAPLPALALLALLAHDPVRAEDPPDLPSFQGFSLTDAGSFVLPASGLFTAPLGQQAYIPRRPRLNFDTSFGAFVPIDGKEHFDPGFTMDMKFQGQPIPPLFLGAEFVFVTHNVEAGELLSDGWMDRFLFLVPIEFDIPLGGFEGNPISLRFGAAPGLQVAVPYVDGNLQDALFFQGLHLEEETMVAFDVRARIGLRLPVDPHAGFLIEAAYDWSEADGKARLENLAGTTVDTARHHVNLSGVSAMVGFQVVF